MVIHIRRATLSDREAIHALHTASIRELCSTHYSPQQITRWAGFLTPEHYTSVIQDASRHFVVAEIGGEIAGFGQAHLEESEIEAIYVRPDQAGRGVGGSILRYLERPAVDAKLPSLRLTATLNAVPFYERQGFTVVGQGPLRHPSGVMLRCTSMTKILGSGS